MGHLKRDTTPDVRTLSDQDGQPRSTIENRKLWLRKWQNYPHRCNSTGEEQTPYETQQAIDTYPKHKQSDFIKAEEIKSFTEDRAGTPHLSEVRPDDDLNASRRVIELNCNETIDFWHDDGFTPHPG